MENLSEGCEKFPDIPSTGDQQSFFEDGYFFTVTNEKTKDPHKACHSKWVKNLENKVEWLQNGAKFFNFDYKTIVIRYGQTFAN